MVRPTSITQIICSFCGLSQSEVAYIIVGPGVYICNECVELCQDILSEQPLEGARDTRHEIQSPRTPLRVLDRAAAQRVDNQQCFECGETHTPNMLIFAAADSTTPAESDPMSHAITAEAMQDAPIALCLTCAQTLILSSLNKRVCTLCHQSRLVREFPNPVLHVCIRCAKTAVWLLEHRESEPDVLMAMRALLEGGMHVLFDRVVSAAKGGHLHRMEFDGTALQALRSAGLIHRNAFRVPATAVGCIANSCHSDGVWLRVESERVPEANIEFTAPTL